MDSYEHSRKFSPDRYIIVIIIITIIIISYILMFIVEPGCLYM